VDPGQVVMSDEPACLAALGALLLAALASPANTATGRTYGALAASGACWGAALAMRPIVGILVLPPLALVLLARRRDRRVSLPRAAGAWLVGAAWLPALAVCALHRSGLAVWQWSGYEFWTPARYGSLLDTLSLRSDAWSQVRERLLHGSGLLFGWPNDKANWMLGPLWPTLGWLGATLAARRAPQSAPQHAPLAHRLALALALWCVLHLLFFALYFYSSPRFYLAPATVPVAGFAILCGWGLAHRGWRRVAGILGATLALGLTLAAWNDLRQERVPRLHRERTRQAFHVWLRRSDAQRARRTLSFDTVHAQALGLLTPEVAAGIREWGALPDTLHVRRLRLNGFLEGRDAPPTGRDATGSGGGRQNARGAPSR
jgi:hypothetical protein